MLLAQSTRAVSRRRLRTARPARALHPIRSGTLLAHSLQGCFALTAPLRFVFPQRAGEVAAAALREKIGTAQVSCEEVRRAGASGGWDPPSLSPSAPRDLVPAQPTTAPALVSTPLLVNLHRTRRGTWTGLGAWWRCAAWRAPAARRRT